MPNANFFSHLFHTLLRCAYIWVFCLFCNPTNADDSPSKHVTLPFRKPIEKQEISTEPNRPVQEPQAQQESHDETFEPKSQAPRLPKNQEQLTDTTTINDIQHHTNPVQPQKSEQNRKQVFVPTENSVSIVSYILSGLAGLSILAIFILGCFKFANLWKQHLRSTNTLRRINNTHETGQKKVRVCPRCGWKSPLEATECLNPKCRTRF